MFVSFTIESKVYNFLTSPMYRHHAFVAEMISFMKTHACSPKLGVTDKDNAKYDKCQAQVWRPGR